MIKTPKTLKERLKHSSAYPLLKAITATLRYRLPVIWIIGVYRFGLRYRYTIGFTPDMVNDFSQLKRVSTLNRYRVVNGERPDIGVYWALGATYKEPQNDWPLTVNGLCRDISKTYVEQLHHEVFGYGVSVDPLSFDGDAFVKSDDNGLHDGTIQRLPVKTPVPGMVYQRLVNNATADGARRELRLQICGGQIPYVYVIYRELTDKIGGRMMRRTQLCDPETELSEDEIRKILAMASAIGLDLGEIDALRDQDDGRLYVIDINRAVGGLRKPGEFTTETAYWRSLLELADLFESSFVISKGREGQ